MKKKILLVLLLCFAIIFPGCSNGNETQSTSTQESTQEQNQIKTKLEINGYPDAKEFVVGYALNDENPFGKYYKTFRYIRENENAVKIRYISIGNKTFELNYKRTEVVPCNAYDVYTLKDNEKIEVYYHKDTDVVNRFISFERSLSEIFPYGEYAMDTEESLKAYSESIAKLVGFDLSGLIYNPKTSGYEKDGTSFLVDEYVKLEYNEKVIEERYCEWKKIYTNGKSLLSFKVSFSYMNGDFRVKSISFQSLPDKVFTLSDEDAIELVTKGDSNFRIQNIGYQIVCNNKLSIYVGYEYDHVYDSGLTFTSSKTVHIFPSEMTFP